MATNTSPSIDSVIVNKEAIKAGMTVHLIYSGKGRTGKVERVTTNNVLVETPDGYRNFAIHRIEEENKGSILTSKG
jgi:hypothetical protein